MTTRKSPATPAAPQSSIRLRHSVLGVAGCLLLLGGATGCKKDPTTAKWGLPVDAKQLPGTTDVIEAEVIDGTRETDPHVRTMYTTAELGSEICRVGSSDPARQLEIMGTMGSSGAKQFFKQANLDQVQSLMECGSLLTTNLDQPFQTAIGFKDDSNTAQGVGILKLKVDDLPPKYGLTKHAFSGMDGFCRTSDPSKPNAPVMDCTATSEAALHQGSSWFLGKRAGIDAIAHTIATPKPDLTTQVAALNDAAAELEGLSSTRIQAQLTTSKPFLQAPCEWGGLQTSGSLTGFVSSCFPNTDDKVIQDIDAKLRAAAFEIEPDVVKAGAVHGNVVLIARDDDAAKEIQKDATDLATDWKSQIQNNEAKQILQAKTNPTSLRQKSWAIIVDNFQRALENIKVTRSGRSVKLAFNEKLGDDDKKDLDEANKDTMDKRVAVANLLDAVQAKKPLPVADLTKIVGGPWATYLVNAATFDPTVKAPMTSIECTAAKASVKGMKAKDMPNGAGLLSELQTMNCKAPPQLIAAVHTCVVAGFHSAADLAKCAPPAEPPESEFGDKPAKSAAK
jgi:hypothetical protein